jgi:hypothetical protein
MIETGYAYRVRDKYLKEQMKTYKKCMKQTHKNEVITERERERRKKRICRGRTQIVWRRKNKEKMEGKRERS